MDNCDVESLLAVQDISFKGLNDLNHDFLRGIYQKLLVRETSESHEALHLLRSLRNNSLISYEMRHAISLFLEWSRELLAIHWNLYTNCEQAFFRRDSLQQEQSPTDLVSLCIYECSDCFMELIRTKAILPNYYNRTGYSLFYLAICANKIDIAQELLSKMSLGQILEPAYIVSGYCPETTFQLAAGNQELFNTCWVKLESDPGPNLSHTLDHCHLASISQFATDKLASDMLDRGINLASTITKHALSTWNRIALYHPDPEPLFNWLWVHECWPPCSQDGMDTPLVVTARYDRVKETYWLLYHSCDMSEQWICAMEAATRQTDQSINILGMVMKRMSLSVPTRPESNWVINLADEVVQGACNYARATKLEGTDVIERRAIQKVECINNFSENSLLFSNVLLSGTREAALPNLADFLQVHNSQTRSMIALD